METSNKLLLASSPIYKKKSNSITKTEKLNEDRSINSSFSKLNDFKKEVSLVDQRHQIKNLIESMMLEEQGFTSNLQSRMMESHLKLPTTESHLSKIRKQSFDFPKKSAEVYSYHRQNNTRLIQRKSQEFVAKLHDSIKMEENPVIPGNISLYGYHRESVEKLDINERPFLNFKNVEDSLSEEEEINDIDKWSVNIKETGLFKKIWDVVITLSIIYLVIASPILLSFPEYMNTRVKVIEIMIDIILLCDIIVMFLTPYRNNEDEQVTNNKKIAINYLRTWFFTDALAAIPFSLFPDESSESFVSFFKFSKLIRLFKMIKLAKFMKLVSIIENNDKQKKLLDEFNISAKIVRITVFAISFTLFIHSFACLWIFIGNLSEDNWILYTFEEYSNFDLYTASWYYVLTTVFTIGYGDILSKNTLERFYSIFLMSYGVLIYSFAVTSISTLMTKYDKLTTIFMNRMNWLGKVKQKYRMTTNLYLQIARYIKHNYKLNQTEKFELIDELPSKIKETLLVRMFEDFIENLKFFQGKSKKFIFKVIFLLKPIRMIKGEYIIFEGDYVQEVFFIKKGSASVNLSAKYNELKILELRRFEYFGDILALSNERSPFNVKVTSKTIDMYFLKKTDLTDLETEFKKSIFEIYSVSSFNYGVLLDVARKRIEKIENTQIKDVNFESNNIIYTVNSNSSDPFSKIQMIGKEEKETGISRRQSCIKSFKSLSSNSKNSSRKSVKFSSFDLSEGLERLDKKKYSSFKNSRSESAKLNSPFKKGPKEKKSSYLKGLNENFNKKRTLSEIVLVNMSAIMQEKRVQNKDPALFLEREFKYAVSLHDRRRLENQQINKMEKIFNMLGKLL